MTQYSSNIDLQIETDEDKGWAITERELEQRRTAAVERDGLDIRALTLINPGNPTGQVLSREDLEVICKFCAKHDSKCGIATKFINLPPIYLT